MAYAMTKHGSQDNQVVNEFVCDTAADLPLIDKCDVTLGSVAIVLHGDLGLEVYIAENLQEAVNNGYFRYYFSQVFNPAGQN